MRDDSYTGWRKSSFSSYTGNCVEVATGPGKVAVRDSKQLGRGPILEFSRAGWAVFLDAARTGELGAR